MTRKTEVVVALARRLKDHPDQIPHVLGYLAGTVPTPVFFDCLRDVEGHVRHQPKSLQEGVQQ